MQGMDVFNFGLRVVPSGIKELLQAIGLTINEIDMIHFHQANRFMTDFFARKLKFSVDKVPYSLERFGNTSAASIPLNLVYTLSDGSFPDRKHVIMAGFGAGLAWGTAYLSLENLKLSELIEY
jgi:3-oxoacyl-[acyl-carrier-protein] synthase III